jgi:hypothetical protein
MILLAIPMVVIVPLILARLYASRAVKIADGGVE